MKSRLSDGHWLIWKSKISGRWFAAAPLGKPELTGVFSTFEQARQHYLAQVSCG